MLLDQRSEAVEPIAHISVTQCQMHFHAGRNDDHDAFSLPRSCRFAAAALLPLAQTPAVHCPSRSPHAVRRLHETAQGRECRQFIRHAVASCGALRAVRPNSSRQRNAMLVATPWRRQTCAAATPGLSVSSTIALFCSSVKLRRFERSSAALGVKRYLLRTQLAALLNWARAPG